MSKDTYNVTLEITETTKLVYEIQVIVEANDTSEAGKIAVAKKYKYGDDYTNEDTIDCLDISDKSVEATRIIKLN